MKVNNGPIRTINRQECYRLAQGIQQELLADQPPYSFEAEDERQACESWERRDTE